MNAKVILAGAFLILALCMTLVGFIGFRKKSYGKFIGASAAVYASGCLLILILAMVRKNLPILFFILSDLLVTMVFVMTSVMLVFASTKLSEPAKKQQ